MFVKPYQQSTTIRFAHCDPAGIVFYPRYFEMINNVVEDWLAEALHWPLPHIVLERGEGFPTVNVECQFLSSARLGDVLIFELSVLKIGNSACTLLIEAHCQNKTVLKASHVLVYTSLGTGTGKTDAERERSLRIPDELRAEMMRYLIQS